MNVHLLSDHDLWNKTYDLAKKEQQTTLELLEHLLEVERRRLPLKRSYASIWEYVVKALGYSESQASERISAMRLMRRSPEAKEALVKGTLGLTQAAMTERYVREKEKEEKVPREEIETLVQTLEGKSKRETEKILLELSPKEERPEKVRPITEDQTELRFSIPEEIRQAMERYWEIHGKGSISEMFSNCLRFYLEKKDPRQSVEKEKSEMNGTDYQRGNKNEFLQVDNAPLLFPEKVEKPSRYIPKGIRQDVRKHANNRCQYVDPKTQRRCQSRHRLQVDHIEPFFLGGTSERENLRMLCAAHNRYLGRKMFGCETITPFSRQAVEFTS